MASLTPDLETAFLELEQVAPLGDSELVRQGLVRLVNEVREQGALVIRGLKPTEKRQLA